MQRLTVLTESLGLEYTPFRSLFMLVLVVVLVVFDVAFFAFRAEGSIYPLPVPRGTGLNKAMYLSPEGAKHYGVCHPFGVCKF
jgi:hypothetical protein